MVTMVEKVMKTLNAIGMEDILLPVFYHAPVGIRFEIGGEEAVFLGDTSETEVINPAYIAHGFLRVKTIYNMLPQPPDILRIDLYPQSKQEEDGRVNDICKKTGLPTPEERREQNLKIEDEDVTRVSFYWSLQGRDAIILSLLEEIVRADLGGMSMFSSSVFFLDTYNAVLFHPYDDRGADLVAAKPETILPLFETLNHWILAHDREKITSVFRR